MNIQIHCTSNHNASLFMINNETVNIIELIKRFSTSLKSSKTKLKRWSNYALKFFLLSYLWTFLQHSFHSCCFYFNAFNDYNFHHIFNIFFLLFQSYIFCIHTFFRSLCFSFSSLAFSIAISDELQKSMQKSTNTSRYSRISQTMIFYTISILSRLHLQSAFSNAF